MHSREEIIKELQTVMPLTKRLLFTRTHAMLQEYNLSGSEFELFATLQHCDRAPSSKELGKHLHLSPGAVSQLVDSLSQLGYVEQVTDEHDRRIQRLQLTTRGKKISAVIHQNKHVLIRGVLEQLTTEELSQLLKIQQKIAGILQKES